MIANNIFRAFGDFCTDIAFKVYDVFRFTDGWYASNAVNVVLVVTGFIAAFYWLGQMSKQSRAGEQ